MTTIHRLLDEAFAGVETTPEVLDLKDEVRANLEARVAELEADGLSATDAAQRAMRELGDVRELIAELPDTATAVSGLPNSGTAEWALNRVRPKPGFVVRTVLLSLLALAGLTVVVLDAFGIIAVAPAGLALAIVAIALPLGVVTADALRQETSTNYPLSSWRAIGFGAATAFMLGGLGIGWLVIRGADPLWLIGAAIAIVIAIGLFAYLGATATNRHKAWALRHSERYQQVGNRFEEDPASAARFGIYSAVIWTTAIVVFIVLSFTVGWAWSWLALIGGFLVMMITLARMLFPPKKA